MKAANATADRLVAGAGCDFLMRFSVAGGAIKRERLLLNLRRAEHHLPRARSLRFGLGESQHPARGAASPHVGIDIHAAQLHRALAGRFKAEHAGQLVLRTRDEERSLARAIISRNDVDLFGERARYIVFEGFRQMRRRNQPVDANEERAHLGRVAVLVTTNVERSAHRLSEAGRRMKIQTPPSDADWMRTRISRWRSAKSPTQEKAMSSVPRARAASMRPRKLSFDMHGAISVKNILPTVGRAP